MLLFPPTGPAAARRPSSALLLVLLVILALFQVSVAQDNTDANDAATTDAATTDDATATTASETTGTNTESTSSTESTTSSTSTSIPVVTVPPTADAPYMQTSSTPEGAVFIAVGAVLGFFGLAVLAWRGLVAWSVNRSVRQAAMMHSSETKGLLRSRRKRSTVRSRGPSGSNMPFGKPGGGAAGGASGGYQRHRSGSGSGSHGPPPKTSKVVPSSNSGLFFSPTAGARMYSSSRRPPVYHPSGYHAAPGGDATQSPPYRQTYNNPNAYYSHSRGQSGASSPPTSPILYPTGVYDTHARYPMSRPMSSDNTSNSSLNLNHASPPQGRAPSEYLEDLFDNHGQSPPRGNFGRM